MPFRYLLLGVFLGQVGRDNYLEMSQKVDELVCRTVLQDGSKLECFCRQIMEG